MPSSRVPGGRSRIAGSKPCIDLIRRRERAAGRLVSALATPTSAYSGLPQSRPLPHVGFSTSASCRNADSSPRWRRRCRGPRSGERLRPRRAGVRAHQRLPPPQHRASGKILEHNQTDRAKDEPEHDVDEVSLRTVPIFRSRSDPTGRSRNDCGSLPSSTLPSVCSSVPTVSTVRRRGFVSSHRAGARAPRRGGRSRHGPPAPARAASRSGLGCPS
jgi:hypothetical protein